VLSLLVAAGMVLPGGLPGRAARGQDDWDAAKKAIDRRNQEDRFGVPDFDQWVLGGKTLDQTDLALRSQFALQVDAVNCAGELSSAQREKLQLAGEGDLKRLSRSINQLRDKYRAIGQDLEKYNDFNIEASRLRTKIQSGVYDDSSLFQKVLRQTLNREQAARYEQQELERRRFRYEAEIERVLSSMEDGILLRGEQQQRLVKLFLDETEPPKKFGQYDFYFVLFQAGKLGEAKLRPILDDAQWQSLKKVVDRYRGIEGILKSQGYLP
jgi:hypothetical protein